MKRLRQKWLDTSIKTKTTLLMGTGVLIMWAIVVMVILQLRTFSQQSQIIMNEYRNITGFLDAFSAENVCLETYIRPTSESNALEEYLKSIEVTNQHLSDLKPSWSQDRHKEFMLKQAIQNAMEFYRRSQAQMLEIEYHDQLIEQYLSLKTQSAYIDGYTRDLLHTSMIYGGEQWQEIEASNTRASSQFLVFMMLGTIALILILLMFNHNILKPLDDLSRAADTIGTGCYDAPPLEIHGNNELGRTARSFNLMQMEIRQSFRAMEKQSEMEKRLLEKEVEAAQMQRMLQEGRFAQLQSQINPHFLFNTLNTIAAMAREEQAPLSEDLILRLSNFFRYSLGSDEKLVPLGREIQLLRDYIELQETRFGERITMEIHSDPTTEDVMVPKFILQPLVENSILHGLRECSGGGLIRVRTHRGPNGVIIHVTDNGCGFDPRRQQSPNNSRRSLGLLNITERMELSGGSLNIFSRPGLGTSIRIIVNEEAST